MSEHPIDVQHLTHRYRRAEHAAVDDFSFTVGVGEILGLLGPNGAGKTTTLHIILGLIEPTEGSVRIFGHSPLRERTEALPRMNFASIDVELPSNLTVRECLQIFARLYSVDRPHALVERLMEQFEVTSLQRHLIGSLSAGEHMRLKLCKALINSPDVLILDEPTLSLDPYMAQKVRDVLKCIQQQRGMSILHTSHNMQEVETFCDRIVFLHRGRKLTEGRPLQVLAQFRSPSLNELFVRVAAGGELYEATEAAP